MTFLVLAALLAASTSVELVDENFKIPHSDWRYAEVSLRQRPALVTASYKVDSGSHKVRMALLTRANMENLSDGWPYGVLAKTEEGPKGEFRFRVRERGDYVVVLDNRGSKNLPADVHLLVSLDFSDRDIPIITGISRQRQLAVIGAAFLFFFGVVTFAARKIMSAIRQ